MTLENELAKFLDALLGKNRSGATVRAYRTDVQQLITFLHDTNVAITAVGDVRKVDIVDYLSWLAKKGLTGIARARKLAAIREYFRYLEGVGPLTNRPRQGLRRPSGRSIQEPTFGLMSIRKCSRWPGRAPETTRSSKHSCKPASGSRVANFTIDDVDFLKPAITVQGKGGVEREIALEKRGMQALKSYLAVRGDSLSERLFLNYQGKPISERGIMRGER